MDRRSASTIQYMNNRGASILASGDPQNAIVLFSGALQLAKELILTTGEERDPRTTATISIDECMIRSCGCDDTEAMESAVDDRLPYMYRQVTLIPDALTKDMDYTSISVIIIFNLALAHHAEAYEHSGALCLKLMNKATQFYELAFQLHDALPSNAGDTFFFLALVNNLALANHALSDMQSSEHCLQQLLSTLMHITESGIASLDSARRYNGFFRNVSHSVSPHITAPAA
jgi:hypothetical protein